MAAHKPFALALIALIAAAGSPLAAQDLPQPAALPAPLPEELVLYGDHVITVLIAGQPVRLEISGDAFGPPVINPQVAAALGLVPEYSRGWRFGPVSVDGSATRAPIDFGAGASVIPLTWADQQVSARADGIIGPHNLPHRRVTLRLAPPADGESVQAFPLKRSGDGNARVGTEVTVGKRQLMMVFVPDRRENLITAPTANFIATHQEGGFEPGTNGIAVMNFGVERPTRMMRIAEPIMLGDLAVDRFAVWVEDYGDPRRVGEIGENDPRFGKGQILVSRRKGRGKPDLLTRIGRDQIAHCSALTYDFGVSEIRLSCTPLPAE
jgi:hypothetical protein